MKLPKFGKDEKDTFAKLAAIAAILILSGHLFQQKKKNPKATDEQFWGGSY
jgi:hypothetical protein